VCVSDTWLNSDISNSEILDERYEIFRKDRESRGGGVLVAVKSESFKSIREIKTDGHLEIVIIDILTDSNSHLIVRSCYRPPNSNEAWLTEFNNFLADICNNYDNVILAGDFNFRNIVWQSDIDAPTKETCKL
jgi:exonuclease III